MGLGPAGELLRQGAVEKRGSQFLRGLAGSSKDSGPLCSGPQAVEGFKLGVVGLEQCLVQSKHP